MDKRQCKNGIYLQNLQNCAHVAYQKSRQIKRVLLHTVCLKICLPYFLKLILPNHLSTRQTLQIPIPLLHKYNFNSVDVLAVGVIADGRFCYAVFLCILNYRLPKPHCCVILFMANRLSPAFRFCLSNSTLTQVLSIRYLFFLFVTHHCNSYKNPHDNCIKTLTKRRYLWYHSKLPSNGVLHVLQWFFCCKTC